MSSVSFDPVAHQYDASRGFPEEAGRQIVSAIDRAVNGDAQTRFFEVGVGTGRIAVPLAGLGRQYTGIDISENMLSRLEGKLRSSGWQEAPLVEGSPESQDMLRELEVRRFVNAEKQGSMRLLLADMTAIPFQDHTFDAVIAVHVFHLVSEWQKALQEVMRILRPGGALMRCWDENWEDLWRPGLDDIRMQWCSIVEELGGSTARPGVGEQVVSTWLEQQGFETEHVGVVSWEYEVTPRAIFQGIEQRIWTSTLFVPEDLFAVSIQRLRSWMDEHYGATIDTPSRQVKRMLISKTRIG